MKKSWENISFQRKEPLLLISISRPSIRNAVDSKTAHELAEAFRIFENDNDLKVAIFHSTGGIFCAGADLSKISKGNGQNQMTEPSLDRDENIKNKQYEAPMGPSRFLLSKPVIGAIEGYAVAGGLELSLFCDIRIVARDTIFGVYCRRFGVPLIDGGTVRLPKIIGLGRALDLVLTGRSVNADESFQIGLSNRIVEPGKTLEEAEKLGLLISKFPQQCLRNDRKSTYESCDLSFYEGLKNEYFKGMEVLRSGETIQGATKFAEKKEGRHGDFNFFKSKL